MKCWTTWFWQKWNKVKPPWAYDVVSTSILGWNNVAASTTRYQRCFNVVLKTLHQRYRIDVVSTWNQGLFFDVNWRVQRCFNIVFRTLHQRCRIDVVSTWNQGWFFVNVVYWRCNNVNNIDARTICIFNIFTTSFRLTSDVVSTLYRRLFAHWYLWIK